MVLLLPVDTPWSHSNRVHLLCILQLLLRAGGRLDSALITGFTMVSRSASQLTEAAGQVLDLPDDAAVVTGADTGHAEEAIAKRCREILAEMPTSLLQDAAVLWSDCVANGDEDAAYKNLTLIHHYRQVNID